MSDPKRWRSASSDAPGEARALLLAARPAPPLTPELRAASAEAVRTLAAQGVSATLLGSATVKLGLAIVGAIAGGALWWGLTRQEQGAPVETPRPAVVALPAAPPTPLERDASPIPAAAAAPIPPPSPASERAASPRASGGASPAPAASLAHPVSPTPARAASPPRSVAESAPAVASPAPSSASPSPAVVSDTLAREAALLESARSALDQAPERALRETDRHFSEFPEGQLSAEREILAIDALGRLGRHAAAEDRAQAFLATEPQQVLKERVLRILKRNRPVDSVKGR